MSDTCIPASHISACLFHLQQQQSRALTTSRLPAWLTSLLPSGSRSSDHMSLTWPQAMTAAERLVHTKGGSVINPKDLLGGDLSLLTENIRRLLGSGHPVLSTISSYYFSQQGKHVRPLIVLLMAQATSIADKDPVSFPSVPLTDAEMDFPLSKCVSAISFSASSSQTLVSSGADASTSSPQQISLVSSASPAAALDSSAASVPEIVLPTQRRLAEITEMIHTASLLHDDVIDTSMTRRSSPSANAEFGNKMAILAGDFLLARASVALARLRDPRVVDLLSTAISNLVEGEFMQLRNSALKHSKSAYSAKHGILPPSVTGLVETQDRFQYYMEKTYMKTASLIAISCRASAVLGGCTDSVADLAYLYGRNLGLAFQLVDDMLDFVVTADQFGKPVNADLKLGLATAPVLYAAHQFPELYPLIERKFESKGDVELALDLVHKSNGVSQTRDLAAAYCQEAISAISSLPPSLAQTALIQLTQAVLTRKK
ncbi:hypothetical protein BASA83_006375 [Batrachochytrium salamandrivorans]|nr:hypothetical protein BASA83_006375 [Batrachochytrium salamandrivorans]